MAKSRSTGTAAEADHYVGLRLRERRIMLGLTQQQLAEMIGVTYQQEHKYERGLNRISAGRLFDMARHLSVPVSWFFEGLGGAPRTENPRERLTLEIARNFATITEPSHQSAISDLVRALTPTLKPIVDPTHFSGING